MTATAFRQIHPNPSLALHDVSKLRSLRNAVIGSRTRKSEIVAQGTVPGLVNLLSNDETNDEVLGLVASIICSLAHAAPPPTLLSLCRAGATEAIFRSLNSLVNRMSDTLSSRSVEEFNSKSISDLLKDQLKLLELLLRALRALLMALSDEVAPGTRWERGLGLGNRTTSNHFSQTRINASGKSAREVVGWHMADAGFDSDGDAKMMSRSNSNLGATSKDDQVHTSHRQELMILARKAIATTFHPDNLHLWLGALFVAKLPFATKTKQDSSSQDRISTRPSSPATIVRGSSMSHDVNISRSSSRMSLSSDIGSRLPHSSDPVLSTPISSGKVRILSIVEMVAGILSSCLAVVSQEGDSGKDNSSRLPTEVIARRRKAILDFTAAQSRYWWPSNSTLYSTKEVDEEEESEARGRVEQKEVEIDEIQGSFVKRGKSIDGRNMDEKEQEDAVRLHRLKEAQRKTAMMAADPSFSPDDGVLSVLLEGVECGYAKTQEASLWALTDLSKENKETSRKLFSCTTPSGRIPTSMLLDLRKDPSANVRLAAFSCLAHIIKVHPFTPRTNECVLSVLVELMNVAGEVQIAAIFAFARLVADDADLQALACDSYECIEKLGQLLANSKANSYTSPANLSTSSAEGIREGLADRLREATLTALAALCFQGDDTRRKFVDHTTPSLLPLVVASLSAPQIGIRIAACRLVRALSRSISILRTSLVDAGVADRLLAILQDDHEDQEVRLEAIASICNLVLKFSPMKQVLLDGGGIAKLVEMVKDDSMDGSTKLNALWAIKNLLYSSETNIKGEVMQALGSKLLRQMCLSNDDDIQEQALNIVRNLCNSREEDIEATLLAFGGGDELINMIEEVIWQRRNDNAIEQAAFVIVNLASGSDDHRKLIIGKPNLLDAMVYFLNHPRAQIRVAGIWAAFNLTQPTRTPHIALEAALCLKSFGFDKRLKELVDDPERDVSDRARGLISRFESP
ncbi:ARM repeat-containing protein [Meira miltonrushii]|uniref:ARM repeat-containing protein n=1 Tax=Meira miltonrushii TaxID=1280837 RepID=A0A316VGX7_9BASI|nr:ARM repeat-containing protein [Meira miltonrushii]PWN35583.1 ARM repeat-containing protein [Meira miltonrushii]